MSGLPTFFGPPLRPLFGMLHWPERPVRGAAVLCPPFGYERVSAHTTFRLLADRLAAAGIATLRFDHDGTGNSAGTELDPDRLPAWRASTIEAVRTMRAWSGTDPVVVGLRLGATLAAAAAAEVEAAGLVLWDPVVDGRRFVRGLKLLADPIDDDAAPTQAAPLSVAGIAYTEECLAALSAVRLSPPALPAAPGLWISRPDNASSVEDLPAGWDLEAIAGTDRLLDVDAELSVVPDTIIGRIAAWVTSHAPPPAVAPAMPSLDTVADEQVGSQTLVHRVGRVGAGGVFVVETTCGDPDGRPAVLLPNNGVAATVGPGRSWVEVARRLAPAGYRVVRMDIGGIGDTEPHPGRPLHDTYAPTAGGDVHEVVEHLRSTGSPECAVMGLCSSATFGFDADLLGSRLTTIIAINGRFDAPFHDRRTDRRLRAAAQTNRLLAIPLSKTPLLSTFDRVPRPIWKLLAAMRLVGLPTGMVRARVATGEPFLLVFGDAEPGARALRRRAGDVCERWAAAGRLEIVEVAGLDHSMFRPKARAEVLDLCVAHLTRVMPPIADPARR